MILKDYVLVGILSVTVTAVSILMLKEHTDSDLVAAVPGWAAAFLVGLCWPMRS